MRIPGLAAAVLLASSSLGCEDNRFNNPESRHPGTETEEQGIARATTGEPSGIGTYSKGFRMGIVTKAGVEGLVMESCEAQLMMGKDGTHYETTYYTTISGTDKDPDREIPTTEIINPWYFSGDPSRCGELADHAGKYVWVRYHQARIGGLSRETDYTFVDIQPVTKAFPHEMVCTDLSEKKGNKGDGVYVGRIVKASSKGTANKSYELMVQVGDSGNQFKHLSTTSEDIYACAVEVLKSGISAQVHYSESYVLSSPTQDTRYNIWEIEPHVVEDL